MDALIPEQHNTAAYAAQTACTDVPGVSDVTRNPSESTHATDSANSTHRYRSACPEPSLSSLNGESPAKRRPGRPTVER